MLAPFALSSDPGDYSGERLINYFIRQADGASQVVTMGRTGFEATTNFGAPVERFARLGNTVYAFTLGGIHKLDGTQVATFAPGDDVRVAANATQIAIVSGGRYYVFNGSTVTQYTPGAISNPIDVVEVDDYFIVFGSIGDRHDAMQSSELSDGTTFDALKFAHAEGDSDAITGVIVDRRDIVIFGERTIEIWGNAGTSGFPFQRSGGAIIEQGCTNRETIAKGDNTVFFQNQKNQICRLQGLTAQVLSSQSVWEEINASTVTHGFMYHDRGHEFYVVRRAGKTAFAFDLTTQRTVEFSTGADHGEWAVYNTFWDRGTQYLGAAGGKIGTQAGYDDGGEVIRAEVVSIPIVNGGDWFNVKKLHVNISDGDKVFERVPEVALQTSRDGKSWTDEKWRDLGAIGQHRLRATWNALGAFRWAQMRLYITDPVNRDIVGGKYGI